MNLLKNRKDLICQLSKFHPLLFICLLHSCLCNLCYPLANNLLAVSLLSNLSNVWELYTSKSIKSFSEIVDNFQVQEDLQVAWAWCFNHQDPNEEWGKIAGKMPHGGHQNALPLFRRLHNKPNYHGKHSSFFNSEELNIQLPCPIEGGTDVNNGQNEQTRFPNWRGCR